MNKVITLIVGGRFILMGIYHLFTGHSTGFSAGNTVGNSLTIDNNPIEFTLSISFKIILGCLCIIKSLSEKKLNN